MARVLNCSNTTQVLHILEIIWIKHRPENNINPKTSEQNVSDNRNFGNLIIVTHLIDVNIECLPPFEHLSTIQNCCYRIGGHWRGSPLAEWSSPSFKSNHSSHGLDALALVTFPNIIQNHSCGCYWKPLWCGIVSWPLWSIAVQNSHCSSKSGNTSLEAKVSKAGLARIPSV